MSEEDTTSAFSIFLRSLLTYCDTYYDDIDDENESGESGEDKKKDEKIGEVVKKIDQGNKEEKKVPQIPKVDLTVLRAKEEALVLGETMIKAKQVKPDNDDRKKTLRLLILMRSRMQGNINNFFQEVYRRLMFTFEKVINDVFVYEEKSFIEKGVDWFTKAIKELFGFTAIAMEEIAKNVIQGAAFGSLGGIVAAVIGGVLHCPGLVLSAGQIALFGAGAAGLYGVGEGLKAAKDRIKAKLAENMENQNLYEFAKLIVTFWGAEYKRFFAAVVHVLVYRFSEFICFTEAASTIKMAQMFADMIIVSLKKGNLSVASYFRIVAPTNITRLVFETAEFAFNIYGGVNDSIEDIIRPISKSWFNPVRKDVRLIFDQKNCKVFEEWYLDVLPTELQTYQFFYEFLEFHPKNFKFHEMLIHSKAFCKATMEYFCPSFGEVSQKLPVKFILPEEIEDGDSGHPPSSSASTGGGGDSKDNGNSGDGSKDGDNSKRFFGRNLRGHSNYPIHMLQNSGSNSNGGYSGRSLQMKEFSLSTGIYSEILSSMAVHLRQECPSFYNDEGDKALAFDEKRLAESWKVDLLQMKEHLKVVRIQDKGLDESLSENFAKLSISSESLMEKEKVHAEVKKEKNKFSRRTDKRANPQQRRNSLEEAESDLHTLSVGKGDFHVSLSFKFPSKGRAYNKNTRKSVNDLHPHHPHVNIKNPPTYSSRNMYEQQFPSLALHQYQQKRETTYLRSQNESSLYLPRNPSTAFHVYPLSTGYDEDTHKDPMKFKTREIDPSMIRRNQQRVENIQSKYSYLQSQYEGVPQSTPAVFEKQTMSFER